MRTRVEGILCCLQRGAGLTLKGLSVGIDGILCEEEIGRVKGEGRNVSKTQPSCD